LPQETSNIALLCGFEILTDYCFALSQSTRLTDGRTDRQTESQSQYRAYASQSHGKMKN